MVPVLSKTLAELPAWASPRPASRCSRWDVAEAEKGAFLLYPRACDPEQECTTPPHPRGSLLESGPGAQPRRPPGTRPGPHLS